MGHDWYNRYGGFEDRVILLGTGYFLQKLCSANAVFLSGFEINLESKLFRHFYTIHCFVEEKIITTAYALLYNNSKEAYSKMLKMIKNSVKRKRLDFKPSTFYIDVDINLMSSIEEIFGKEVTIKLSLYDYANSVWFKVKSLGLAQSDDRNVEKAIRRMCCLAIIPVDQIEDAWIKIKEEAPQNENLLELISYINEAFMISKDGHKFDKNTWNHYDTDNIKMINHLEGWSDFIDEDNKKTDLSVKNFIIKLKKKQGDFEKEIFVNQKKSNEISKIPKKYKALEEKFKHAKERLENGKISVIEYLDEII
ncbi:uncharacterized protein LOC112595735 [Melanaphis sacchari]|uniref:uncharacterized protein LOC112595735 n=1 Tax=Melanaphis sacchari TaxID=742174 RepID=UPI000DC14DD1|nr:uncharacterized protein LOC112595735 [Melanaphis sacchari]